MRYAQNNDVYESTTQCATDWSSINWYKVEKYVDKLQKRIYHAESIGDSRKVRDLQLNVLHKLIKVKEHLESMEKSSKLINNVEN